jgi:HNH endonuclease
MNTYIANPAYHRLDTLLALGVSQVDELARKAGGTLTSYNLLLGRCLLVMRESQGFKEYGCSSEIHYATTRLGLGKRTASTCRRVAKDLLSLPELTLVAEQGTIAWSKLREISRKATVETETFWIELSKKLDYDAIQSLVGKTPEGAFPGDVFEESERATSELRCVVSESVLAMLDRARRMYSLEQDKAVTTAEVLEWALTSYITNQPVDDDTLEKIREDMDQDLQAEKTRQIPLVAQAREMAAEMGYIPVPELEEDESDECARAGTDDNTEDDPLARALGGSPYMDLMPNPDTSKDSCAEFARAGKDHTSECCSTPGIELAKIVFTKDAASAKLLQTGLPAIKNKRICFNPLNRHTTKAQKREVLRRESWRCACPACPNRLYLHIHHLIPYSQGGPTLPESLLGLCSACHKNVHDGFLRIFQSKEGTLVFTDADGNSLAKQADLELARWLDCYQGWKGERVDSHSMRVRNGDWAVFA